MHAQRVGRCGCSDGGAVPARNNRVMRTAAEDSVPDVTRHADACTRAVGRRKATADAQWAQRRVNVQGTAGALRPPHARTHRLGPRKEKKTKKNSPRRGNRENEPISGITGSRGGARSRLLFTLEAFAARSLEIQFGSCRLSLHLVYLGLD